ncbi:MAG: nitroreductase [Sinimarinibacterium sp.]|jgi:nitroreductase
MQVTEAVRSRRSVRAFLDTPVPGAVLREAIELAARAPSGGNLQPWRIFALAGAPLAEIKAGVAQRLQKADPQERPEYAVYPPDLWEPHRTERFDLGEAMYALLGIPRADKAGRLRQFARNYQFFGAPAGLFCYVDRRMGPPQWSDLGMYLQTLMLLLRERDLDSCAQECWSAYPKTVASVLKPPPELMLFCGMSIGYADPDAPINRLHSRRLPLEGFAEFRGFD